MLMKKIMSWLYIIAVISVILAAGFQIYSLFNPAFNCTSNSSLSIDDSSSQNSTEGQDNWKYGFLCISIINILALSILKIIELITIKKQLSKNSILSLKDFSDYLEDRNGILYNLHPSGYSEGAMRQCFHLITNCLKKYIGNHYYFEISVFTNKDEPYIFAYYDTHGNVRPTSYNQRANNPLYYKEKQYEVIELLEDPSSEVFVIPSTKKSNYKFANKKQKKQISSQIMYCFHMENPYALVITCNKKDAFKSDDLIIKNFIRDICQILNSDLLIQERLCCRKSFQCEQTV